MFDDILSQYPIFSHQENHLERITDGLINATWRLNDQWILQRVNPIFGPDVNRDIQVLTQILRQRVQVPTLINNCNGEPFCKIDTGENAGIWRIMTFCEGDCIHSTQNISQIRSLSDNLAQFHTALLGEKYTFRFSRGNVHVFDRHREKLERAISEHPRHACWERVVSLYNQLQALFRLCPGDPALNPELPRHIVHGDPKISNFLFKGDEVCAILDLDTMAWASLESEIGDALRSWCNGHDENHEPALNSDYVAEALEIYQTKCPWLTREERQCFPAAGFKIAAELSMRFAADALCEDYFAFDPAIAPTHGEHSLLRAQNQCLLAESFLDTL